MTRTTHSLIRHLQLLLVAISLQFSSYALAETSDPTITVTPEENIKLAEEAFDKSDIINSMNYYRKAAEAGNTSAMSRLAYLLDKSEEDEEAIKWFNKAVALGDAEAQFELARMYAYGEGVEQDKKTAFKLFTQSADQRYAHAIRVLAQAYENGDLDLRIDYELAQHWLNLGVQADDHWSIKRLAKAYRKGDLGLRINKLKAEQLEQLVE